MIKALLVSMLLTVSAHAETLDSIVAKANAALTPTKLNQTGFEVEWREENGYVWFNITRVTFMCRKKEDRFYIVGKELQKQVIEDCQPFMTDTKNALYQIACEKARGNECKKLLSKSVTVDIIRNQTNRNISDVYVK